VKKKKQKEQSRWIRIKNGESRVMKLGITPNVEESRRGERTRKEEGTREESSSKEGTILIGVISTGYTNDTSIIARVLYKK
jgi:hypothetical protein